MTTTPTFVGCLTLPAAQYHRRAGTPFLALSFALVKADGEACYWSNDLQTHIPESALYVAGQPS